MSSEFFANYPRIAYDISGNNSTVPDYTVAVNLMIRNKLKDTVEDEEAANDLILVQFPPVPDASSPSAPELKLSAVLAVGVAFRLL